MKGNNPLSIIQIKKFIIIEKKMEKILKIFILILMIIEILNSFSLNSKEFKLKSKNLRDEKIKMEIQLKGFY
jgi:hypothetical protein